MLRRALLFVACASALALLAGPSACGREDVNLDPDDDAGEDAESRGDGGLADAIPPSD